MMRGAFPVLLACALGVALPSGALAETALELTNAGFEQIDANGRAAGWTTHRNWHAERGAGHNGSGGMVYECTNETDAARGGRPAQSVKVVAGKRYLFSALAKAEGLTTERRSPAQGLTLYMEGYNASNKWVFGAAAKPCVSGQSRDWVKIEGLTCEIPEGVVRAYVQPYAPGRGIGRAVLDNVYVREYDVPPVEGVFANAYRRELTGGKVVFHASINTDRANALGDYAAEFSFAGASGETVRVPGKIVSAAEAAVELDVGAFAFGRHEVACTLFLKGKALGSGAAEFTRVATPTPRKVRIDEFRRTIVDGKPFFPLGMYFGDASPSNVDVFADSAFNCLMPYRRPDRAQMDYCHRKGLKVIYDLQGGFREKDAGERWVRGTVQKFQDHPALLAWYTNDEHPLTDVPKLAARQRWVEELDPHHPTWSVQDVFSEVRHYLTTYDVLGMDPYPIPRRPIETVISSMRQGEAGTFGTKAVWQVPQAFGWGWLKRRETKGQRAPTREEMANMTWQSIAGGANGIVYYAFHHLYEEHEDPNDAFAPAWARTKAVAAEVGKYVPVLLSVEPAPRAVDVPAALAVRTWRHDGAVYALVVNCTAEAQTATIRFTGTLGASVAAELGPVPKRTGADRLEVAFGPIEYAMLKFK